MHKETKNAKSFVGHGKDIPVREVYSLHNNSAAGMDMSITFRDEDSPTDVLPDTDIRRSGFTARGRITQTGLARLLEKAEEKYRIEVKVLCLRRVR